jgi:anthranilate synthase component 1
MSREQYHQMVEKAKEYILAGDVFQVVPSQRFAADFAYSGFELYRVLRRLNPSPYSFYMKMDDFSLVGSSPEILVRSEAGKVTVRPIAGTRKRGIDDGEDSDLAADLLSDQKELAEHLMLIDLGRNDMGRVSDIGSVKLTQ